MSSEQTAGFRGLHVPDLLAQLHAQAETISKQAAQLAHSRKIFDRASEAARIGVWECSLPDERLTWTDVVYDIFDMPRGAPLDRGAAVKLYSDESARELELRRSRAIAELSGFSLDAEITTMRGNRRWIRITATVESEGGRPIGIFGMKQDITEEKILLDRTRYLADFDPMTGLPNRSQFQAKLAESSEREGQPGGLGSLLLVDLDGFKQINDSFGHAVGDACLVEAGHRLAEVCKEAHLVARIGGDEFAVIVGAEQDRAVVALMARRIIEAMALPVDHLGRQLVFGASVGVAFAEGGAPDYLFTRADTALYAAKAAGRGTFRLCQSAGTYRRDSGHAA